MRTARSSCATTRPLAPWRHRKLRILVILVLVVALSWSRLGDTALTAAVVALAGALAQSLVWPDRQPTQRRTLRAAR